MATFDRACFGSVVLAALKTKDDAEIGERCRDLLWGALSSCKSGQDLAGNIRNIIALPSNGGLEWLYGRARASGASANIK